MKKYLSMFLVLSMLIGVLSACTKDEDSSDTSSSSATSSEATATESKEWSWPLTEKKELNIWLVWDSEFVEKPEDLVAIQKIEEMTNVHINWQVVASSEAAEKFSLMIASGEYPDIIRGAESYYSGGLVKMMDDGVSIDLTDKLAAYMPTYSAIRSANEKILKDTSTDDGNAVAVYTVASHTGEVMGERIWGGPCIRQDWLEETGMEIPVTIDDWYAVLTAIKANHPEAEAPLMLANDATDYYGSFISAYGILSEFFIDGETVKYGPVEDGYKAWIETLRKWYAEGLIDQNFVTNDASFLASADYIGTGKAAAGANIWGLTADVYKNMGYTEDEKFWLAATPYPVLNAGDTPQAGAAMSELIKESLVVTSACEDVELAMRFLDFMYTDEAMLLDSLGIKDDSYVVNEDGTFSISQKLRDMVTDGTYPTLSEVVYSYTLGTADFGLYNWGMFDAIYEGNRATEAYDVWNTAKYDIMYPAYATMTDVESQEYASIYTNITTLVQENTVKFIMGTASMDEYDKFVEQLHTYGIDRCIELKQAALDRYNAR